MGDCHRELAAQHCAASQKNCRRCKLCKLVCIDASNQFSQPKNGLIEDSAHPPHTHHVARITGPEAASSSSAANPPSHLRAILLAWWNCTANRAVDDCF